MTPVDISRLYDKELEQKVKILLGLPPYDTWTNYCYADHYFAHALKTQYGEKAVQDMTKKVRRAQEGKKR